MNGLEIIDGFDWSTLSDSAGSFAIEIAKAETKNIAEKSIGEIKDAWRKIDWPGRQKNTKTILLKQSARQEFSATPNPST